MKRPFILAAVRAEVRRALRDRRLIDLAYLRCETGAHHAKLRSLVLDVISSGSASQPLPSRRTEPDGGVAAHARPVPDTSGRAILRAAASPTSQLRRA